MEIGPAELGSPSDSKTQGAGAERSSETLAIQDVQSEDLQIKRGGFRKEGQQLNNAPTDNEIGDKISKIDENEDIPIYYSDQSMDDKLPITPRADQPSAGRQLIYQDVGRNDDELVVVHAADPIIVERTDHCDNQRRGEDFGLVDETAQVPKEQIEMLVRENEEIRRQIAEVKMQMEDESQARAQQM